MSELKLNLPPTHEERKLAQEGFQQLIPLMNEINHPENVPEITIMETGEPNKILKLFL